MAVLDVEFWMEEIDGVPQIVHSFYKKPVASPFTILKRSALPYTTKKSTLLQEALRRLGNCSDSVPEAEVSLHLSRYGNMLRISGYSEKERYNMIKGNAQQTQRDAGRG